MGAEFVMIVIFDHAEDRLLVHAPDQVLVPFFDQSGYEFIRAIDQDRQVLVLVAAQDIGQGLIGILGQVPVFSLFGQVGIDIQIVEKEAVYGGVLVQDPLCQVLCHEILPFQLRHVHPVLVGPVVIPVQTVTLIISVVIPRFLKRADIQIGVDRVAGGMQLGQLLRAELLGIDDHEVISLELVDPEGRGVHAHKDPVAFFRGILRYLLTAGSFFRFFSAGPLFPGPAAAGTEDDQQQQQRRHARKPFFNHPPTLFPFFCAVLQSVSLFRSSFSSSPSHRGGRGQTAHRGPVSAPL